MTKTFSRLSMDVTIREICGQAFLVLCGDPVTSSARTYQTPWSLYQGCEHGEMPRVRAESEGLRLSLPLQETKGEEL